MFFSKNGHKRVHPFTKKYIFANDLHIIDSKIGPSKISTKRPLKEINDKPGWTFIDHIQGKNKNN